MLFLCGLTCRIILYNRPCTSQRGIALPLWKPLLNQQQYPARITWRFLIRAGAAAPLSNFALTRKVVLKRRMASLHSVRPRSLLPRVCRNASGKLLSHPFAALTALVAVGYRHFCNSPSYERLFVKFYLQKKCKKYENQQKMIPKRLLLSCSYSRSVLLLPGSDA